jgi:hypothetical protein
MAYLVAEIIDPYQLKATSTVNTVPLRFGSYINAQIIGNQLAQATTLPRYLVIDNKVAILDKQERLQYVAIDIIRQQGSDVIVVNGLDDGDRLITSALDYPIEGMKLALEIDDSELNNEDNNTDETPAANTQLSGVR